MSFLGQFVYVEQMEEIRAFIPPRDYNQRKREAEELLAQRTVPFREYEIAFPDLQSFPNVCQEDSLVSVLQAWAVTRTVNHMHCVAEDIRAVCRQREICGEAKETIMMRVKQHKLYCCVSDSKKLLQQWRGLIVNVNEMRSAGMQSTLGGPLDDVSIFGENSNNLPEPQPGLLQLSQSGSGLATDVREGDVQTQPMLSPEQPTSSEARRIGSERWLHVERRFGPY